MDEFTLIELLNSRLPPLPAEVLVGVGDDCAVLPPQNRRRVVTVDSQVEGKHFDLTYFSPEDVGWKALAVAVSDIAAMGGECEGAVVNLQLRSGLEPEFYARLYDGLAQYSLLSGCPIIGGNIASGSELSVTITVLGTVERPLLRSGCLVGDDLWVSGPVGASFFGLQILSGQRIEREPALHEKLSTAHLRPNPPLKLARALGAISGVHAMCDISDGLIQDSAHLGRASSVRIQLDSLEIVVPSTSTPKDSAHAITSGEDYELLLSATPEVRAELQKSFPQLRRVGMVTEGSGVSILGEDSTDYLKRHNLIRGGFSHL